MEAVYEPVEPLVLFRVRQVEYVFLVQDDIADDVFAVRQRHLVDGLVRRLVGERRSAQQGGDREGQNSVAH